eukprot:2442110-Amphidinium_carterae.1
MRKDVSVSYSPLQWVHQKPAVHTSFIVVGVRCQVYARKSALAAVVNDLGLCSDCAAPTAPGETVYVHKEKPHTDTEIQRRGDQRGTRTHGHASTQELCTWSLYTTSA